MIRREAAYAKINLFLHVTARRPDGFHALQSLAVFADCGEYVEAEEAHETSLALSGPFAEAAGGGEGNLAWRALALLGKTARLKVDKQIPVGAGLGGGSADAGAVMRLFGAESVELAAKLGSDVPACLRSVPVWMEGRGEVLREVVLPPLHLVLVNPRQPLATAGMFGALAQPFRREIVLPDGFMDVEALLAWLQGQGNDFEPVAVRRLPRVGEILQRISAQPGCRLARLSGSGPTCFGVFTHAEEAARAAHVLEAEGDWVKQVITTGRHGQT